MAKSNPISAKKSSGSAPAPPIVATAKSTELLSGSDLGDSSSEEGSEDDDDNEEEDVDMDAPGVDLRSSSRRKDKGKEKERSGDGVRYPAYQPPANMTPLTATPTYASDPFEWNNLAAKKGVELWCIRVPSNFKPSRLAQLSVSSSSLSSSSSTSSLPLGTLTTAKRTYHLHPSTPSTSSLSSTSNPQTDGPTLISTAPQEVTPQQETILAENMNLHVNTLDSIQEGKEGEGKLQALRVTGGEEMSGLRLMLPRVQKGGKMMQAPIPIKRHLILTPSPSSLLPPTTASQPIEDSAFPSFTTTTTLNVPVTTLLSGTKRPQPDGKLKFRNVPFGAGPGLSVELGEVVGGKRGVDVMSSAQGEGVKEKTKEKGEKKSKKRKEGK